MHADRTTRALLTLLGLALLAAGITGILATTEVFGHRFGHRHLTDNPVARYLGDNGIWFWPAAALTGVIAALLALRWLIAVLAPRPHASTVTISTDRSAGPTALDADALTDAVTAEINSYRGIDTSHARVYGSANDPQLAITVRTDADADIAAVHQRVENSALAHIRQALDRPDLPVVLDLTVGDRSSSRVR